MLPENVRGLSAARFVGYRAQVLARLADLGHEIWWGLVNARDYEVPQLCPRLVLVGIRQPCAAAFRWPRPQAGRPPNVGEAIGDLMSSRGWPAAAVPAERASTIEGTIVGSSKPGGPDLGRTGVGAAWRELGVDRLDIADQSPAPGLPADWLPKLTVRMAARLQGFPDSWQIAGRKTVAYRQAGSVFPRSVARTLGTAIASAMNHPVSESIHSTSSRQRLPRVGSTPLPLKQRC